MKTIGERGQALKAWFINAVDADTEAFNACLDGGEFRASVQQDFSEGAEIGVTGTPAFFVNGRFLSGAQPFEQFKQLIDEELEMVN